MDKGLQMITEQDIRDMYLHLRKTNTNIPDEALGFMKDVCMQKIKENIIAEFEGEYIYDELIETKLIFNNKGHIEFYGSMNNWEADEEKKYKIIIKEVE